MPLTIPDQPYRFIALDVETANGAPWSISQIGIACVDRDNALAVHKTYVNPRCGFAPFNIKLTGITPEHVADAPVFGDVLAALRPVLDRTPVFQHSGFDARAMRAAAERARLDMPDWDWLDSVRVARRAWPEFTGRGGHGLAHLKERLALQFSHHDAGEDARAAAEVVLKAEAKMGVDFRMIHDTAKTRKRAKGFLPKPNPEGALLGLSLVFTGELSMSRAEAATKAAAVGIKVTQRLNRTSTHLVVGGATLPLIETDAPSRKELQARDMQAAGHGIQMLDEAGFLTLLRRGEAG